MSLLVWTSPKIEKTDCTVNMWINSVYNDEPNHIHFKISIRKASNVMVVCLIWTHSTSVWGCVICSFFFLFLTWRKFIKTESKSNLIKSFADQMLFSRSNMFYHNKINGPTLTIHWLVYTNDYPQFMFFSRSRPTTSRQHLQYN